MNTKRSVSLAVGATALAVVAIFSIQGASSAALSRVSAEHVCMVNDTRFHAPQIPVQVAGKTYYGCCAMCKGRLNNDPVVRSAVDPVSGKPVDKATAVIAAMPNGKVLYFESERNLKAYRAP
jgi:YHS domain-containing protein